MTKSLQRFLPLVAALPLVLAGCATYTHEYPNYSAEEVWNAALAVAESPDYDNDWHVTQNEVWVDDEWARIEIQRELRRLTSAPFTKATPEQRTWQFRVTMKSEDPVVLSFENRNPTMPSWTYDEAERYFTEVSQMLIAAPAAGVPKKEEKPEVKFDEPMPTDDTNAMDDNSDAMPNDSMEPQSN